MRKTFLLLALSFAVAAPRLSSQSVPFLSGRVNDYAGILSTETVWSLEKQLRAHEDSTTNQVVVLTVNSLEGAAVQEYALKAAETWKIGQKGKDNGVLLVVAKDDRKVSIQVGYGLEGTLTDAMCNTIIRREIIPSFKAKDFDGGVRKGVESILAALEGTYTADARTSGRVGSPPGIMFSLVFLGIFLLVVGTFTFIVIFTKGFQNIFLFFFLIPFWFLFPMAVLGPAVGAGTVTFYILTVLVSKLLFRISPAARAVQERFAKNIHPTSGFRRIGGVFGSSGMSSGGWSSGGGGGGFSGGGGSFGGGGSSGSW